MKSERISTEPKTIRLAESQWTAIKKYQHSRMIATEIAALRELINLGLLMARSVETKR